MSISEAKARDLEQRRVWARNKRAAERARLGLPPITRPSTIDRVELERREALVYAPRVCRVVRR